MTTRALEALPARSLVQPDRAGRTKRNADAASCALDRVVSDLVSINGPRLEMASLHAEAALVAFLRRIHSYDVSMSDYGRIITESGDGRHSVAAACAAAADRAHLMSRRIVRQMDKTCLVRLPQGIHGFLKSSLPSFPLGDGQLRLLVYAHADVDGTFASFYLEPAPAWLKRYELGLLEYLLQLMES